MDTEREPFFDVVDTPFERDDVWACFLGLFGKRPVRMIPQIVFRPGGRERMEQAFAEGNQILAEAARNQNAVTS